MAGKSDEVANCKIRTLRVHPNAGDRVGDPDFSIVQRPFPEREREGCGTRSVICKNANREIGAPGKPQVVKNEFV